jgi:hypothetical protein
MIGAWRLVGYERRMEDTGEVIVRPDPLGFTIFEPGGRAMFILHPPGARRTPTTLRRPRCLMG